jgi:hypothetical protein
MVATNVNPNPSDLAVFRKPVDSIQKPTPSNFAPESSYYAAFVLDPDGNNIEAVYRGA